MPLKQNSLVGEPWGPDVEAFGKNVRSFGATGNGSTDDTAAIQEAINAAAAEGGGTVFVPKGDYIVSSSLILKSYVTIIGTGTKSRLFGANPAVDILKANAADTLVNVRLIDLSFTHSGGLLTTGSSVYLDTVLDSWLVRCYGNRFRFVTCAEMRLDYCVGDSGWFDFTNLKASFVHGCLSYWARNNAGDVSGFKLDTCDDNHFSSCNVTQATKHGVELVNSRNNTFTGLIATNSSWATANTWNNIDIDATSHRNKFVGGRSANHLYYDARTYENHARNSVFIAAGADRNQFQGMAVEPAQTGNFTTLSTSTIKTDTTDDIHWIFGPGADLKTLSGDLGINPTANIALRRPTYSLSFLQASTAFAQQVTALTYSASIATNAALGNLFTIVATNGTAFSIVNPTNPVTGMVITYDIKNSSGGAHGVITWGTGFLNGGAGTVGTGAFAGIANGKRRTISFYYDGTNWIELSRTADI